MRGSPEGSTGRTGKKPGSEALRGGLAIAMVLLLPAGADIAKDLERWPKEMVDDLGIVGKVLNQLVGAFANVAQLDRSRRAQSMKQVFEAMGVDRKELTEVAGTRVVIDSQIPPLFGYQPCQEDM
jgi:hypothetical protein